MMKIHNEDKWNDTYGRERMYIALKLKSQAGEISVPIPSESTVRKVMEQVGLIHKPNILSSIANNGVVCSAAKSGCKAIGFARTV